MPSANMLATIAGLLITLIGIQATTGTQKTEPAPTQQLEVLGNAG
jgi:cell division protein FtsN